jgi:hypothetical protein
VPVVVIVPVPDTLTALEETVVAKVTAVAAAWPLVVI